MEDAQKAIAEAEARTADYGEKTSPMPAPKSSRCGSKRVKQWNAERDAALDEARKAAGAKVSQAKAELETEAAAARKTIQGSAGDLAGQVVRAVLPAAAGGSR